MQIPPDNKDDKPEPTGFQKFAKWFLIVSVSLLGLVVLLVLIGSSESGSGLTQDEKQRRCFQAGVACDRDWNPVAVTPLKGN